MSNLSRLKTIAIAIVFCVTLTLTLKSEAQESGITIEYRSFSGVPTIGAPADQYMAQLAQLSQQTLGRQQQINFSKISPRPKIPNNDIIEAVGTGGKLVNGAGFDAAYISGGSLNQVWGFIYNSGIPVTDVGFEQFIGFLYGAEPGQGGIDLAQSILDQRGRNIVAIPLVGGSSQGSGYFPQPVSDTEQESGIGLTGLCRQPWTFRYLPPAQDILDLACDRLVGAEKKINFVTAVPGGQILDNVISNKVQAFEFVTPKDDLEIFFADPEKQNLGDLGLKYLHYPSWHQPFLITYLIINRQVWEMLSSAQQDLIITSAQANMTASYSRNLVGQGEALQKILAANSDDANEDNDITLVKWSEADLASLQEAVAEFLVSRKEDRNYSAEDRQDYQQILSAYQNYLEQDGNYWGKFNKFTATNN